MPSNRLALEKSPYLLQHAHNPVDWFPWGPEAFEKARAENKPIFLSIGYSTCHWCHVMERESFESQAIADLLNRHYIPVKVDREERPDVDRIYMHFVQATTGSGGWPMSVWLTPDLQPFFGGTYFPPDARYGQPGFTSILTQIASAWTTNRAEVVESARDIVEQLQRQAAFDPLRAGPPPLDASLLDSGFYLFRRSFDARLGGFGGAPKFPRPSVFNFLLRHYAGTGNQEALDMVLFTLREMAKGGMHDQLGGGFHRYSVDDRWFVPHFEKMLYDQGQLAVSYLEAFQITGDALFAETARRTLDYVLRDMSAGAFHSAEDADSAADPAHPQHKSEGAFYIWTAAEIRALIGQPAAEWFAYRYGVQERGNVDHDPHNEFAGRNILFRAHTLQETTARFGLPEPEVRHALERAETALLEARGRRPRPHLDDKILTAWNGLMISAFAKAGTVLGDARYAQAARAAADFLLENMYDPAAGLLLRRYRAGDAAVAGFLEDYALFAQGLLDLYEAQFEFRDLETAARLTEKMIELFEDRERGGFFGAAAGPDLIVRVKEDYDGAEPSGNSVAVMNLLRLARLWNRADFRESAERTLSAFATRLSAASFALPQMLAACELLLRAPREVVIAGERGAADTEALLRTLHSRFSPFRVTLLVDSEATRASLAAGNPAIQAMGKVEGRAAAYVCANFACQLPVSEPGRLEALIQ
ncbi:MAG TPA: thioredoxin domain-containing protein [Bryobacteraceae bacterium]|nr:thioredoxin domain-containing protein [Bryobacteraceae bacterium]